MQLERLLLNIETLVTRSRNIEEIDAHVTVAILHHRRWHLQSTLRENIELVLQSGQRTMTAYNLLENNVLVHSMYRRWFRGGKHREGYLPAAINSNPLLISKADNLRILRSIDTPQVRILYLDEFRERCQILLEAVEKGELDDLFGILPFEILHRIIGLYGELLPRLDIDPMKSRIHKVGKYKIIEIENEDQADSEERAHPEMVEGLKLTLEKLLVAREDPEEAETVFKELYRLLDGGTGAPKYPEFSWDFLQYFLDVGVPFLLRPRE